MCEKQIAGVNGRLCGQSLALCGEEGMWIVRVEGSVGIGSLWCTPFILLPHASLVALLSYKAAQTGLSDPPQAASHL